MSSNSYLPYKRDLLRSADHRLKHLLVTNLKNFGMTGHPTWFQNLQLRGVDVRPW